MSTSLTSQDFIQLIVVDPRSPQVGIVLQRWENYETVQDLFTPSDWFRFTIRVGTQRTGLDAETLALARETVGEDMVVQIVAGKDHSLLSTGIVDDIFEGGDRKGGHMMVISGRDGASMLTDNIADPRLTFSKLTLPELGDKVLERYRGKGISFNVLSDNDSNRDVLTGKRKPLIKRVGGVSPKSVRTAAGEFKIPNTVSHPDRVSVDFVRLPVEEARPHGGETEYQFLDRHSQNVGVMMWMSADGNLIFSRPNYNQDVLFSLRRKFSGGSNIISGGRRRNRANSATEVRMYGHTTGRGSFKQQLRETVSLPPGSYIWPRTHVIHDSHCKTGDRAKRQARRALSRANTNIESLEYTMLDHDQNGIYYCPDTLAFVDDEWAGVKGVYYIVTRSIRKSRSEGTTTTLKLLPKDAYVLD